MMTEYFNNLGNNSKNYYQLICKLMICHDRPNNISINRENINNVLRNPKKTAFDSSIIKTGLEELIKTNQLDEI